jgi:hypothetical protein
MGPDAIIACGSIDQELIGRESVENPGEAKGPGK